MATRLSSGERARLTAGLAAICREAGIDPTGAKLIRYTMNAVYRIDSAGVVVRMATGPEAAAQAERVARVATAFADLGLPTVRLDPRFGEPVHADGWSATVWMLLPQPEGSRFSARDLALPLRGIHSSVVRPLDLPEWDPIGKAHRRIAQAEQLGGLTGASLRTWAERYVGAPLAEVLAALRLRCEEVTQQLKGLQWSLPWTVIHGDAHRGNLLRDLDGAVVICDLDSVAAGPAEWDLVPTAHGVVRFGDAPDLQREFALAYGIDLTAQPAWPTLRRVRDLQLVTSVISDIPGRPTVAAQLASRIRSVLTGTDPTVWRRFQ